MPHKMWLKVRFLLAMDQASELRKQFEFEQQSAVEKENVNMSKKSVCSIVKFWRGSLIFIKRINSLCKIVRNWP